MSGLAETTAEQEKYYAKRWHQHASNWVHLIMIALIVSGWGLFITQSGKYVSLSATLDETNVMLNAAILDYNNITAENEQLLSINRKMSKIIPETYAGSNKVYNYIVTYYRRTPNKVANIIANTVMKIAKRYNIDETIIVAVMEEESDFDPYACSSKNARGLMQVRHSVWKDYLEMEDQFDLHYIDTGTDAGVRVLLHYLKKADGDLTEALYLYCGKDRKYPERVFANIGKFMVFNALEE